MHGECEKCPHLNWCEQQIFLIPHWLTREFSMYMVCDGAPPKEESWSALYLLALVNALAPGEYFERGA